MTNTKSLQQKLKEWFAKDPRNKMILANHLFYNCSNTVEKWVTKGIPKFRTEEIEKYLQEQNQ